MKKLTLNADPDVIELAKKLAEERGTSVSTMFSGFIRSLAGGRRTKAIPLSPLTRKATGLVKLPRGKSDRQLIEEAMIHRYGL